MHLDCRFPKPYVAKKGFRLFLVGCHKSISCTKVCAMRRGRAARRAQGAGDASESVAGTLQVARLRGSSRKQAKSAAECCTWCVEGQGQAHELAVTVGWLGGGRGGDFDGPLGGCVAPCSNQERLQHIQGGPAGFRGVFFPARLVKLSGVSRGRHPHSWSTREGVVSGPQRLSAWTPWKRSDLRGNQAVVAVVGTPGQ
jgi:hypothetical protein